MINPGYVTSETKGLLTAEFIEAHFEWLDGTNVTYYNGLQMKGLEVTNQKKISLKREIAADNAKFCFAFNFDSSDIQPQWCAAEKAFVCEYNCQNPTAVLRCPSDAAYSVPEGFVYYPSADAYYRDVRLH